MSFLNLKFLRSRRPFGLVIAVGMIMGLGKRGSVGDTGQLLLLAAYILTELELQGPMGPSF